MLKFMIAIMCFAVCSFGREARAADRPNIVLIMADDMGYEALSSNGSLDYQTPYLDELAIQGFRFEHCYSQPICTPTRVKLMTGLSNRRNYVRFGRLARDQRTFGNLFQDAGYKTCIAGKWQLGSERDAPQHFGFEQALLWQHTRGRAVDGFDSRFPNPRLERNGEKLDFNMGEFSSNLFSDFINDFMERNKDDSFLVYYPMALTHCPFSPTPDSKEWDPTSRGSRDYKGKPQFFRDMVAYVDKTVAKIDGQLKTLGIRENTLLIFIGDNGTDTPIVTNTTFGKVVGAKGSMTDGGNHVPCVVSWPGVIKAGKVTRDIIDVSDMLPTICEAAGIDLPHNIPFDGVSFLSQLKGEKGTPRDSIYMWYARNGGSNAKIFARNQTYKLYSTGEFFHIPSDRIEKTNLADAELNDQAKAIKAMLQKNIDSFARINYLSSTAVKRGRSNRKNELLVLGYKMNSLDGKQVDLSKKYKGKVLLIVNVASECGATPQYKNLQNLHKKYSKQGMAILGFPCNQFGDQEPGTAKQIRTFCKNIYGVEFDIFAKVDVNGTKQAPLFKYLTSKNGYPKDSGAINWNFEKFLVSRDGKVVNRFRTQVNPEDDRVVKAIEAELRTAKKN